MSSIIISLLPNKFQEILAPIPDDSVKLLAFLLFVVVIIIFSAIYIAFVVLILKLNKHIFKKAKKDRGNSITFQFLEKAIALALILLLVVIPLGGEKISQSLLGSTAVIAAVVGLAANDVIKDMFAGLQISLYKPFDVGSRIMLEDGRAGVVKSVTLRHVVLTLIDKTTIIIPNSRANSMIIVNYSYDLNIPKAFDLRIPISYESDVEKAKEVIKHTICTCPFTLNEDTSNDDDPNSRFIYFLDIQDSALLIGATVYYPQHIRTEVVRDELNTELFKALNANGIEIPYNYMNVVMKKNEE